MVGSAALVCVITIISSQKHRCKNLFYALMLLWYVWFHALFLVCSVSSHTPGPMSLYLLIYTDCRSGEEQGWISWGWFFLLPSHQTFVVTPNEWHRSQLIPHFYGTHDSQDCVKKGSHRSNVWALFWPSSTVLCDSVHTTVSLSGALLRLLMDTLWCLWPPCPGEGTCSRTLWPVFFHVMNRCMW